MLKKIFCNAFKLEKSTHHKMQTLVNTLIILCLLAIIQHALKNIRK
jgi:hypothetical protein